MGDVATKLLQIGPEGMYTPGGTSSSLSVYNGGSPVNATRRIAVEKGLAVEWKDVRQKPTEARGHYAGRFTTLLHQTSADGKAPMMVYCDDLVLLLRMIASGLPVVTTLPNTPTSLLVATALASSMPALTTQPNAAPDGAVSKLLALTLSNATANTTAVTLTITGTSASGKSITETVSFPLGTTSAAPTGGGAGALSATRYTTNYYATITSITSSATVSGDMLAVGGINGFYCLYVPDTYSSTLISATGEYWDGSAAWQVPGMVAEKLSLNTQVGKSLGADLSFLAQKRNALAATSASISPAASTGARSALTNLTDNIMAAVDTQNAILYADPLGTNPGTTLLSNYLTEAKLDVDAAVKLGKAANQTPNPSFVGRDYYGDKLGAEFTLLFNQWGNPASPDELRQYLLNQPRICRVALPGAQLPCGALSTISDWPSSLQIGGKGGFYGLHYDVGGIWESVAEKDIDGRIGHSYKLAPHVDQSNLGVPYQIGVVSRVHPLQ